MLLLLSTFRGWAQMSISLSSAQGHRGDVVELSLSLQGKSEVTALEATIDLPTHLDYVEGSAVLSQGRANVDHEMSVRQTGRRLSVYIYSLSLLPLRGSEGELLRFSLSLGQEPGSYSLQPAVVLSATDGTAVPCTVASGTITLLGPQAAMSEQQFSFGRVPIRSVYDHTFEVLNTGNEPLTVSSIECSDAEMTVSPAMATIAVGDRQAFVLSFAPQQAGAVQALVVVRSDAADGDQTLVVSAEPYSVNELFVTGGQGRVYEELTIGVSLQNMEPIVAVQCSFTLPDALDYVEGSAIADDTRSIGHTVVGAVDGRRLTFFAYSPDNTSFSGTDGRLFTFRLRLNGAGGTYALQPEEVVISNAAGVNVASDQHEAQVRIAAPRAECDPQLLFGNIPLEQTAHAVLTVGNSGELPLTIQRVEFTDDAFTAEGDLPVIAAGATADINVRYQPQANGPFSGIMQVYTDDPERRMLTIDLQGMVYPTVELQLSGRIVEGQPDKYQLTVSLQNSLPVVAMQFDLHLTPITHQPSPIVHDLTPLRTDRAAGHQALVTPLGDDTYRVFLWSADNSAIGAGQGAVLHIIYNNGGSDDSLIGTVITADNIILSSPNGENIASASTAILKVGGLKGDANDDGQVSIADVVMMVAYLLQQSPAGFVISQADIDDDGTITMTDVMGVSNIILKKE